MTPLDPHPLNQAISYLLREIDRLSTLEISGEPQFTLPTEKLERLARALSVKLKTLSEIENYNRKIKDDTLAEKYLDYEDLPPPSPEDRDRLIARIRLLYDRVNAEEEISETPESAS